MASPFIFTDGFDVYGPPGVTPVLTTQWTSIAGTNAPTIVAGLSFSGYAARLFNNGSMSKTFGASYSRIVGSIRFQCNLAGLAIISFLNGASNAFSFTFETTGVINLRTGTAAGAIVAGGGAILANSTHVLQFDITVGASGAYTVNLDGVLLYSGIGNTGNSQTSVNTITPNIGASSSQNLILDDLILIDPTQAGYNSAILAANAVIETQFVSGDNQTQFTNDGNVVSLAGIAAKGVYRTATGASGSANLLNLLKITPDADCTLNSISFMASISAAAAKIKGVAYTDSAGSPGSRLSDGTEVVGATANAVTTLPLATPQALTGGTSYWIGWYSDTLLTLYRVDATTNLAQTKANTYASGAPVGPLTGMTTGVATWFTWANCTGATVNFLSLNGSPPIGTAASQTHSSTVAQEDLFTFPALVTNPSTIFGVAVKGFISKSDAGARTVSFNSRSGASDVTGSAPSQSLATTSQWQGSYFDVDPATGLPWTTAGTNAAKAGVSVAS